MCWGDYSGGGRRSHRRARRAAGMDYLTLCRDVSFVSKLKLKDTWRLVHLQTSIPFCVGTGLTLNVTIDAGKVSKQSELCHTRDVRVYHFNFRRRN